MRWAGPEGTPPKERTHWQARGASAFRPRGENRPTPRGTSRSENELWRAVCQQRNSSGGQRFGRGSGRERQVAKPQRRQEVSLVRNIAFPASSSGICLRKIGNNEPDFSANSLVGLRSKTSLYTYGRSRPQRAAMPEVSRRLPNRHSGRRAPGGAGWRIQPSSSLNGLVYIQRL